MRRTSRPRRFSRSGAAKASSREAPATAKQETAAVIPSTHAIARGAGLPWYVAAVVIAATSAVVGVMWDISWHRSIGRDTFWTPAHLAIYLGGILAGAACGWRVLKTTFAGTPEEEAAAVTFWGFRGPLGAWVAIWGALAMLASGPFDNWWHNAYGLDVKVLSPPHVILALGFTGIQLGALLLVLSLQNRAADRVREYGLLFAYGAGILLQNVSIMGIEQIGFPNSAHNAEYYQVPGATGASRCWPVSPSSACSSLPSGSSPSSCSVHTPATSRSESTSGTTRAVSARGVTASGASKPTP